MDELNGANPIARFPETGVFVPVRKLDDGVIFKTHVIVSNGQTATQQRSGAAEYNVSPLGFEVQVIENSGSVIVKLDNDPARRYVVDFVDIINAVFAADTKVRGC